MSSITMCFYPPYWAFARKNPGGQGKGPVAPRLPSGMNYQDPEVELILCQRVPPCWHRFFGDSELERSILTIFFILCQLCQGKNLGRQKTKNKIINHFPLQGFGLAQVAHLAQPAHPPPLSGSPGTPGTFHSSASEPGFPLSHS